MIVAFWCVLVAGFLPLVCSYLAKYGPRDPAAPATPFDNHAPRAWLASQTGTRARADAAQQNGFEAFPLFAAGVVIAVLQHVPVATIDLWAVIFVAARIAYIALYLADRAALRSIAYVVGLAATLALFGFAAGGSLR